MQVFLVSCPGDFETAGEAMLRPYTGHVRPDTQKNRPFFFFTA